MTRGASRLQHPLVVKAQDPLRRPLGSFVGGRFFGWLSATTLDQPLNHNLPCPEENLQVPSLAAERRFSAPSGALWSRDTRATWLRPARSTRAPRARRLAQSESALAPAQNLLAAERKPSKSPVLEAHVLS